jgi:hypothetical protein
LVGIVQSAILFPRVTSPVRRLPSAYRPSVAEVHWEHWGRRPTLWVAKKWREVFLVRNVCVRRSTHIGLCAAGLWSACWMSAQR